MKEEIIIKFFLDYEFLFVFLLCSIIFLLISIFIRQKTIRRISILLFSVFLVFFLFELVLSFFMEKCTFIPKDESLFNIPKEQNISSKREVFLLNETNNLSKRIISDNKDEIDRVKKEYLSKGYKVFYDNKLSLYSNGLRYTKANANGEKKYVFLGGSFTFGSCLDDKETLPYYFSELNHFDASILNLSCVARGSNYTLNMLNSETIYAFIGENKEITQFIYSLIDDHIYRNFRMIISSVGGFDPWIKKDNKWVFMADHPYKKIKEIFIRSFLFRKIFLNLIDSINIQYYKNYLLSSLQEINKIIEKKYKSKLTIIVWPEFIDNKFMENLQNLNIDLILLPEYFNSEELGYRLKDHHPTAKANKEIAEILYNHISKNHNLAKGNKEN